MKKIIIILSHCNTEEKQNILKKNILKLRNNFDYDILLTSHITLPENIINLCDYFVYDKSNPILKWPVRAFQHWRDFYTNEGAIKLTYFVDDYGWTPFNQIKKGINTISYLNYDEYVFLNYDLNINEEIISEINKNLESVLYSVKDTYDTISYPSLIFFRVCKSNIELFEKLINLDFYMKNSHAEAMFERISEIINHRKSEIITTDLVDYNNGKNGREYDNSTIDSFCVFFGYESPYDLSMKKYFFFNVKEDFVCEINNSKILVNKGSTKLIESNEEMKIIINNEEFILDFNMDKLQFINVKK